jgi:hypothetical protein
MQPRTSVRQPVIAGARRQHLKELLRQWRRQPRKRSPLLFWTLLLLALMSDCGLFFLTARLLGFWESPTPTTERNIDVPYASDSALWHASTWADRIHESPIAPQALYSSLFAVGLFVAAAVVRQRWPLWRRRFFFVGILSCLGCLVWSASALQGQTLRNGGRLIYDHSQELLWVATVVMAIGLFLGVLFRDAFLAFVGALTSSIGYLAANHWPTVFVELWPALPLGAAEDMCLRLQALTLLSAYAALALAWSIATLTLTRILLEAPSSERLRRLSNLCLWPIRLGIMLLAASALLDGWRALEQGSAWHRWNAQAMGTLLVLPVCVALVYARRRGYLPTFRSFTVVVLGFTVLALTWHLAEHWEAGDLNFGLSLTSDVGYLIAGLFPLSLAAHAALRYYFGKQRILEV